MPEPYQKCPRCGAHNTHARLFCEQCGARLATRSHTPPVYDPIDASTPAQPVGAQPPDRAARPQRKRPAARRGLPGWMMTALGILALAFITALLFGLWQFQANRAAEAPDNAAPAAAAASPTPQPTIPPTTTSAAQPTTAMAGFVTEPDATPELPSPVASPTTIPSATPSPGAPPPRLPTATPFIVPTIPPIPTPAATLVPLSDDTVALFELPVYPSASPANPTDPFVQGLIQSTMEQQTSFERSETAVYRLPPGVNFMEVRDFYVNQLGAAGWSAPGVQNMPLPEGGLSRGHAVWVRESQRVVIIFANDATIEGVGGNDGSYLSISLVTIGG